MKHKPYLKNSIIILPVILMIATVWSYGQVGAAVPVATISPTQNSLPTPTTVGEKEQPIHMPDLIGRSLEYATGIWDADEAMPQFIVESLSNEPNLVVVRQQPAPGTMILPSQTLIKLTLDQGPVQRPSPSPTPLPPTPLSKSNLKLFAAEAAGQATLLRAPYVQNLKTSSVTIVWTSKEGGASEVQYGISDYSLTALATSTYFTTPAAAPYDYYYIHEATLSGLAADTVYQYLILTNGADLTPGGSVTFRTAKPVRQVHSVSRCLAIAEMAARTKRMSQRGCFRSSQIWSYMLATSSTRKQGTTSSKQNSSRFTRIC